MPSHSHSIDGGVAWALIALQGTIQGLHTHGKTGIDIAANQREFGVPEHYRDEASIAIDRIGDKSTWPAGLQAREAPGRRKLVIEIAFLGAFQAAAS